MSDYLSNLVARSINQFETVQPRLPSLFEPMQEISMAPTYDELESEQPAENFLLTPSPKVTRNSQFSNSDRRHEEPPPEEVESPSYPRSPSRTASLPVQQQMATKYDLLPSTENVFTNPTSIPFVQSPEPVTPAPIAPTNSVVNIPKTTTKPLKQNISEPLVIKQTINENTVTKQIILPEKPFTGLQPKIQILNQEKPYAPNFESASDVNKIPSNTERYLEAREIPTPQTQVVVVSPQITPVTKSFERETEERQTAQPAPTIQVTIGRIEIKATYPTTPSTQSRPKPSVMSLDEYLRQRGGGK